MLIKEATIFVEGGIGKNICATRGIYALKKICEKINVICSHPAVFFNFISEENLYTFDEPKLYNKIKNSDIFIQGNIYSNSLWFKQKENMVELWNRLIFEKVLSYFQKENKKIAEKLFNYFNSENIEINNEDENEIKALKEFVLELKKDYGYLIVSEREINILEAYLRQQFNLNLNTLFILFQPFGGNSAGTGNDNPYRNIPLELLNSILNNFTQLRIPVIHIKSPQEPNLNLPFIQDIRLAIASCLFAKSFVGIDSFLQHAWLGINYKDIENEGKLKRKGIVIFGSTSPISNGYKYNENIFVKNCEMQPCMRPSYFFTDFILQGRIWECQYDIICLKKINVKLIFEKLESILKEQIEIA